MLQNHLRSLSKLVIIVSLFGLLSGFIPSQPAEMPTVIPPTEIAAPEAAGATQSVAAEVVANVMTQEKTPTPVVEPTLVPTTETAPAEAGAPEGAAETADGGSVFVEDGKVYKIDASGAKTETELSKEVFTDVFEVGDLVKQLHPEYFGEDQSVLKKELLPTEVGVDRVLTDSMDKIGMATSGDKSTNYIRAIGKVMEVTLVRAEDGVEAQVVHLAVSGSREPIPFAVSLINSNGAITSLPKEADS